MAVAKSADAAAGTHLSLGIARPPGGARLVNLSRGALDLDYRQVLRAVEPRDHEAQLDAGPQAHGRGRCSARPVARIPRTRLESRASIRRAASLVDFARVTVQRLSAVRRKVGPSAADT